MAGLPRNRTTRPFFMTTIRTNLKSILNNNKPLKAIAAIALGAFLFIRANIVRLILILIIFQWQAAVFSLAQGGNLPLTETRGNPALRQGDNLRPRPLAEKTAAIPQALQAHWKSLSGTEMERTLTAQEVAKMGSSLIPLRKNGISLEELGQKIDEYCLEHSIPKGSIELPLLYLCENIYQRGYFPATLALRMLLTKRGPCVEAVIMDSGEGFADLNKDGRPDVVEILDSGRGSYDGKGREGSALRIAMTYFDEPRIITNGWLWERGRAYLVPVNCPRGTMISVKKYLHVPSAVDFRLNETGSRMKEAATGQMVIPALLLASPVNQFYVLEKPGIPDYVLNDSYVTGEKIFDFDLDIGRHYIPANSLGRVKIMTRLYESIKDKVYGSKLRPFVEPIFDETLGHLIPNAIDAVFARIDNGDLKIGDSKVIFRIFANWNSGIFYIELIDNGTGVDPEMLEKWEAHEYATTRYAPVFLGEKGVGMSWALGSVKDNGYCFYLESKTKDGAGYKFVQTPDGKRKIVPADIQVTGTRIVIKVLPSSACAILFSDTREESEEILSCI